jgi:hypothetical protein
LINIPLGYFFYSLNDKIFMDNNTPPEGSIIIDQYILKFTYRQRHIFPILPVHSSACIWSYYHPTPSHPHDPKRKTISPFGIWHRLQTEWPPIFTMIYFSDGVFPIACLPLGGSSSWGSHSPEAFQVLKDQTWMERLLIIVWDFNSPDNIKKDLDLFDKENATENLYLLLVVSEDFFSLQIHIRFHFLKKFEPSHFYITTQQPCRPTPQSLPIHLNDMQIKKTCQSMAVRRTYSAA